MSDYLFDKTGDDAEVAELEQQLGAFAHREPLREIPRVRRRWRGPVAIAGVLAAAAMAFILLRSPAARVACTGTDGMTFSVERGSATCGGKTATSGVLPVGGWIETARDTVLDVAIAKIGHVKVYGDSRVQLVETNDQQHRLALESGKLSARVSAPPRLFVVDTPNATAVDLGCAYDLAVDAAGTHLTVTSGAVSLEGTPFGAFVPAGMTVTSVRGRGVGVPVVTDAPPEERAAIARFEAGTKDAITPILAHAGRRDMITLWHLIARTDGDARGKVVDALTKFVPIPFDTDRAHLIAGDPDALELWRVDVAWEWLLDDRE